MNKDTSDTCIPALRKPKCMASTEKCKEMPYLSMIANGKPNEVLEVLDPKNMEFSCLVELLHPKFISEYLELILNFLTQSINEVRFPDIAPYKAAFLERIVTNPSNLRSDCFNESSKIVISEIISVLETKKNIFKWTFEYENRKSAKSVLIYRKQPLPHSLPIQKPRRYFAEIHDNYFNKVTLLIPRLVLALVMQDFRASLVQVQVAELARESSQSLPITDEIPLSFKKLWIGNTLQFTKDDSRLTLVYPQMPRHYKDFISSMIWDPTKDVKMDPKNLCSPVWEAMRIFWLKYEFWLSSQNIGSDKVDMILEKRPKNAAVKKNDKPETIEKSESQTALFLKPADRLIAVGSPQLQKEEIQSPPVQRRQPTRLKKIELQVIKQLQSLSEQFFNRVFKELMDFLEDHLLASLVFSSVTQSEANFLIRLNSVLKNSYNLDFFPSEHRMTLKKIHSTLAKKSYMTIDVKLEKLQKKTKLRDVKFLKVLKPGPLRTLGPPKQLPLETSDNGMQALGKSTNSPQSTVLVKEKSNPFLRALSVSSEELNSVKSDRLPNNKQSSENRDPSPESQPSRPTSVTKSVTKSKILLDLTDQSVHSGQSSNRSSSRDGLSKAKQKMLEALSVPVQSDKAERMMMLMGWQGGALGVRGEGITEPILPALQIKAGAGLGHVAPLKPTKQAKSDPAKVTPEFRMCFMSDLLQLIRAETEDMTVDYDDPLTDKERYFITSIIKSCNRRREFGLGARDEIEMVRTIIEALLGTPISLIVAISKDRRSVTIAKHMKNELIAKQSKNKKAKQKAEQPDPEQKEKDFKIKMELLKRTLSFVKSDCKRFVINIKEKHPVSSFYTAFFESVVAIANKNVPIVYRNMVDYELYKALVEAVSGFCLELNSEENGEQKFIISKRHRKRFINSALEGTAQKVGKEDCNNDETATLEFAIDNDDTDEGTSLSEDKSCQSNYNSDKIDVKKDTQKVDINRDHDKTDTEKDFDDSEETSKKDLKLEIYEDDWLNCCDSDTTKDLKNDCDKETNNNYVVKSNDYLTKPKRNGNTASMSTIEDVDFKTVHIMPNDYPNVKVDTELGIRIQNDLLEKLKMEVSLPKLRCLGIQNDALVYNCRNENTYLFLTDFVEKSELNLQLVEFPPVTPLTYTVEFKINSLLQTDVSDTFVNFELYNNGLETDKWELLEAQSMENCVFMKVNVDADSYKYICDRRFSLDLGFDTAIFRLVW